MDRWVDEGKKGRTVSLPLSRFAATVGPKTLREEGLISAHCSRVLLKKAGVKKASARITSTNQESRGTEQAAAPFHVHSSKIPTWEVFCLQLENGPSCTNQCNEDKPS